jgi:hypothetical protein
MKQRNRIKQLKSRLYPLFIYIHWCKPTEVKLSPALRRFYAKVQATMENKT